MSSVAMGAIRVRPNAAQFSSQLSSLPSVAELTRSLAAAELAAAGTAASSLRDGVLAVRAALAAFAANFCNSDDRTESGAKSAVSGGASARVAFVRVAFICDSFACVGFAAGAVATD